MTTYAPDFTPRIKYAYKSAGLTHNIQFRFARGSSDSFVANQGQNVGTALFAALAPLLPADFQFLSGTLYHQDSSVGISGQGPPTNPTGAKAVSLYTPMMRATATTFKGNGNGVAAHFEVFGVYWDPSNVTGAAANGRVDASEDATVAAAIGVLTGFAALTNIVSVHPNFYSYATVKPNDYWVKQVRKLFP